MIPLELAPWTVVEAGQRRGMLGAIVFNRASWSAVAITAAQLAVRGESGSNLFVGDRRITSLNAVTHLHSAQPVQPTTAMLLDAPIERGMLIGPAAAVQLSVFNGGGIVREPVLVLGEDVVILGRGGVRRPARLVCVGGIFSMPIVGAKKETEFVGALELIRTSPMPALGPDEAGALVCLPSGELLGIVIAGGRDVAFAAPIGAFAAERGLCAFSEETLADCNRVRAPLAPPAAPSDTSLDHKTRLSAIMEGGVTPATSAKPASQMQADYLDIDALLSGEEVAS